MDIHVITVSADNPDLAHLITKLDKDLMSRYPVEQIFGLDFSDPHVDEITFVVAYSGDQAVGCGALRPLDARNIELKRFFVDAAVRRKGVASKMLAFLEDKAKSMGFQVVRLETGDKQPEAIQLYKKFGYYEIELFGEYINSKQSICFEKQLEIIDDI